MINLRKIITHEKDISDIVHQFNTNNNFDLQDYLRMIKKTKYNDILPLFSKKAFNTFLQKTPYLKVKDILEYKNKYSNWTLKNFRTKKIKNLRLSDVATEDEKVKTFCELHPEDKICVCYYNTKEVLDKFDAILAKYNENWLEEKAQFDKDMATWTLNYNNEVNYKTKELENHRDVVSVGGLRLCCSGVDTSTCKDWCPADTEFEKKEDFFGKDCKVTCRWTASRKSSLLNEFINNYKAMNPEPKEIHQEPPELTGNFQCCINNIEEVGGDVNDVKQTCNQTIINQIDDWKDPEKECEDDDDCKDSNKICSSEKKCINKDPEKKCEDDDDCNGQTCSSEKKCEPKKCDNDKDCTSLGQKCIDSKCSSSGGTPSPPPGGDDEDNKDLAIKILIGIISLVVFIGLCILLYYILKK
jgi:hypothetical protein